MQHIVTFVIDVMMLYCNQLTVMTYLTGRYDVFTAVMIHIAANGKNV